MSRDPEELLSAYVDGVGELTPEERRSIEQLLRDDPAARADQTATRTMLDSLRDLPPIGTEPSWTALEQAISREVGRDVPRLAWWRRNLKWIESSLALAATAAVAVLWISRGESVEPMAPSTAPSQVQRPEQPQPSDDVALWIGDDAVEVGADDAQRVLEDFDDEIHALATEDDGSDTSLLPATGLEWVDGLDDKALERAERWLEREKSG